MATRVTLDDDLHLTVPEELRRRLRLEPGDALLADVRDGVLIMVPEPHDYARRLRGLHRDVWEGIDPEEYVQNERDAWPG